jgi:hypothetical protein
MTNIKKGLKMLKLSCLFKTTLVLAFGLFGHTVTAQEKPTSNLIDNYLGSFANDLSEEFIFGAYCYGILADVGVELEKWGTDDGDPELRKLGENILERADEHYVDYMSLFFEEIDPDWWAKEETSDAEDTAAGEKLDELVWSVGDGDAYYRVYDQLSDYEFYGLYGLCAALFTPDTFLSSDISLEKLILATDGEKPTLQKVIDGMSNASDITINWANTKYTQVSELELCDVNTDFAGGAFMGTAATSLIAGESVAAIIGASGVLVVSAPAIATGATVAALAGSAVYLTSKGYCYWTE